MKQKLRITQLKSCIGVNWKFRLNLKGLGLGRPGKVVEVANTIVSSWSTMLALTYGMMPIAKIERFDSAPPENMLKKPRRPPPCLFTTAFITFRSTPGIVTNAPMR